MEEKSLVPDTEVLPSPRAEVSTVDPARELLAAVALDSLALLFGGSTEACSRVEPVEQPGLPDVLVPLLPDPEPA